jgi:mannose-6-phosphate isomerase
LGARLIGEAAMTRYGGSFPLLLKLLDAARPLSLQVHPDDAAAQRRGAAMGKSEAWWVLAAEADARLWWGLREPVTALALQQALVEGSVMQLMREVLPQPGMVVVNPAGTVHALGAGVLAFEIQQASDTTYRLFDHGATDAEGRPRPLHIAEALAVAQLHPGKELAPAARLLAVGRRELVRSDSFVLEDWGAIEPWQQGAWLLDEGALDEGREALDGECDPSLQSAGVKRRLDGAPPPQVFRLIGIDERSSATHGT